MILHFHNGRQLIDLIKKLSEIGTLVINSKKMSQQALLLTLPSELYSHILSFLLTPIHILKSELKPSINNGFFKTKLGECVKIICSLEGTHSFFNTSLKNKDSQLLFNNQSILQLFDEIWWLVLENQMQLLAIESLSEQVKQQIVKNGVKSFYAKFVHLWNDRFEEVLQNSLSHNLNKLVTKVPPHQYYCTVNVLVFGSK